jgi:release factor glutamine methyltransferase
VTLQEVLRAATEYLERKGVESPRLDSELILAQTLGLTRLELYTQHDRPLSESERAAARALVERRGKREPLAYVLGSWGFRRLTLKTDRRALVPRPETEVVVEAALDLLRSLESPAVLDVGTGTGAIALAIADEHPGAHVTAIDRSPEALALAGENAERTGLEISLLQADLRDGLPPGPFDLVVSNPPYIDAAELDGLQPEVRDWEPREALLDEGQTASLAGRARDVLAPGGWLVLETHGEGAEAVRESCAELGYDPTTIRLDLAGRGRVVEARWPTSTTQSQR